MQLVRSLRLSLPHGGARMGVPGNTLRTAVQPPGAAATSTVVLACRRADPGVVTDATWVMSCLGGLSAADLLAAALRTERIELVSGDCPECPDAAAEAALDLAVATAEGTVAALGQRVDVARTRMPGNASAAEATAATVSRRGLFRFLARGLGQAAAGRCRAQGSAALDQRVAPTSRSPKYPSAAHPRSAGASRARRWLGRDAAARLAAGQPRGDIRVRLGGLCLSYCPHGALDIAGDAVTWAAANCTGCGLCVEVCPRSALRTGPARLTPRRPSEAGAANRPATA